MQKEPALIIGILGAIVVAVLTVAGAGSFDDGLQWEDVGAIATVLLASGIIRQFVWSQNSVDQLNTAPTNRTVRRTT